MNYSKSFYLTYYLSASHTLFVPVLIARKTTLNGWLHSKESFIVGVNLPSGFLRWIFDANELVTEFLFVPCRHIQTARELAL